MLCWHDAAWRLPGSFLVLSATAVSACWWFRLGGFPLLRRQLFPLVFVWLAVPWPVQIERPLTQSLMRGITTFSVNVLNTVGVAAVQRGNVIELSDRAIGIEDACTGIQSLQAVFMAAIFLGEYFSLSVGKRFFLVGLGCVWSISANWLRIMGLVFALHGNSNASPHWHDLIGGAATAGTFLLLYLSALMLKVRRSPEASRPVVMSGIEGREGVFLLSGALLAPLFAWMWFSFLATSSGADASRRHWQLDCSKLDHGWKATPIPATDASRSLLHFTDWAAWRLDGPEGGTIQVDHLFWEHGASMPFASGFYHTPAICMPSAGWTMLGAPAPISIAWEKTNLPCVMYSFEQDGNRLVVIQCLSMGGLTEQRFVGSSRGMGRWKRISTFWKAPLLQVNEELLVYLPDAGSVSLQKKAVEEIFAAVLTPSR